MDVTVNYPDDSEENYSIPAENARVVHRYMDRIMYQLNTKIATSAVVVISAITKN